MLNSAAITSVATLQQGLERLTTYWSGISWILGALTHRAAGIPRNDIDLLAAQEQLAPYVSQPEVVGMADRSKEERSGTTPRFDFGESPPPGKEWGLIASRVRALVPSLHDRWRGLDYDVWVGLFCFQSCTLVVVCLLRLCLCRDSSVQWMDGLLYGFFAPLPALYSTHVLWPTLFQPLSTTLSRGLFLEPSYLLQTVRTAQNPVPKRHTQ